MAISDAHELVFDVVTLYMRYKLTDETIDDIRRDVATNGQTQRTLTLQWMDAAGVVYAEIERLMYITDKEYYEQKNSQQSRFQQ